MKLRSLALITGIAVSGMTIGGAFTPVQAIGTLILTDAGYTGPGLNLSAYANGSYNSTTGPATIPGGITFTSTVSYGSVLGQGDYDLGNNGSLDSTPVYAGLDAGTGFMTFAFSTAVQSFGAYLNYDPSPGVAFTNPVISTYDSSNNLLSSFDLSTAPGGAISTPSGLNQFQFRGISESSAVISSFRLSGSFLVASGVGSTSVPATTPVPEPFTIVGTLIGGTAALRIRKKLKSSNEG